MSQRRPGSHGSGGPDLAGVTATDRLIEALSRGEDLPAGHESDPIARSLAAYAAEVRGVDAVRPPLEDLLAAAGVVIRPASARTPASLERDFGPDGVPLAGRMAADGTTAAGAGAPARPGPAWTETWARTWSELGHTLSDSSMGRRMASAGASAGALARRGADRIGLDADHRPRFSPMAAAAAAVVAFGLTGVATGVFSAQPVTPTVVGGASLAGAEADQVVVLLERARIAAGEGRQEEAALYYLRASALVRSLDSGADRAHLSRQVDALRRELGLPLPTEAADPRLTPSVPGDTSVPASPGTTVVVASPTPAPAPTTPGETVTTPPVTEEGTPSEEPSTSAPDPTPTPTPTPEPTAPADPPASPDESAVPSQAPSDDGSGSGSDSDSGSGSGSESESGSSAVESGSAAQQAADAAAQAAAQAAAAPAGTSEAPVDGSGD